MSSSDRERETIEQWAAGQSRPLTLELATADHPRMEPLRTFCQTMAEACSAVQVREVAAGEELPALRLRQGALLYRSVPSGSELEPFLDALAGDDHGSGAVHGPFRTATLQIYVAAACPHCPAAVRAILPLIAPGGKLRLEVIDSETGELVTHIRLTLHESLANLRGIIPFGLAVSPDGRTILFKQVERLERDLVVAVDSL